MLKRPYQYVRRVNAVMRATTMTTTILKSANTNIHTKVGIDIIKADVKKIILFFMVFLLRTFVYERATLRLREEKKQKRLTASKVRSSSSYFWMKVHKGAQSYDHNSNINQVLRLILRIATLPFPRTRNPDHDFPRRPVPKERDFFLCV